MNSLQKQVDDFMNEMNWQYWDKNKILSKIREETFELNAEIEKGDLAKAEVEMGDLLFAYCCLGNSNNIERDIFNAIIETQIIFAKSLGFEPDKALTKSIQKFKVRDKDRFPDGK